MSIENKITEMLKDAMRKKERHLVDTLRMLKTKLMEKRTSVGFIGEITDEIALDVISSYKKNLQKAVVEFTAVGERANDSIRDLHFEISICEKFLPTQLNEVVLKSLIAEKIKLLNITEIKSIGKVVGLIAKEYKNQVDGATVKKIAELMITTDQ